MYMNNRGCVDRDEIVTYKYNNKLFVESISRMWNRLSTYFNPKLQKKGEEHLYMDLKGVSIYDSKNGFVDTKRMVRNVSKDWVNVNMSNGRSILCTSDHPFPVIDKGRVHCRDLEIGDRIPIIKDQYSENTINVDPDLAWAHGVIICDGSYSSSVSVSIALTGEDEIEDKLSTVMKKVYGSTMVVTERHRGEKGNYKDLYFSNPKKLRDEFSSLFEGILKIHRHIPNDVFSYNRESRLAFLAGMIDADGYINGSGRGVSIVQLGSTNKELALQQFALMQTLGLNARMYKNHYTSKVPEKIRYRVECDVSEELVKYIQCDKKKSSVKSFSRTNKSAITNDYATILSIEYIDDKEAYSYDVTTESDHFDVSGIYSHNCRAFLSPYYERGGFEPADEEDRPVFTGRFNGGVVSLNLPMILAKSRKESKDFYEVLDFYMEMIRNLHKRTREYLGELRASIDPLMFCEGGAYRGHLKPTDKIKPLLDYVTFSYGITALNELNRLYNGKSIREDGEFPLEVMQHINNKLKEYKKEDHILYAVYGTPAESLCGLQVTQFRKMYGIVENVSDRDYVSNSFHCHVSEEMDGIEKQDKEFRFWNLFAGGRIQYVKYPINYNTDGMKTYVRRAMSMGLYEGVNLSIAYCADCGHEELDMDVCPHCGSTDLVKINRMNG